MITAGQLKTEFASLGIAGISVGWKRPRDEPRCSYHDKDGVVVRVVWPDVPTDNQIKKADEIVQSHDGIGSRRTDKLAVMYQQAQAVISDRYPPVVLTGMLAALMQAQGAGLKNRAAYLGQLMTWALEQVPKEYAAAKKEVEAMSDPDAVLKHAWDTSALEKMDPQISLLKASEIKD